MCVRVFSTSADQGIPSQLPSTSMMRMNAPVRSHKGDQAIHSILSLVVFFRVYLEPAGSSNGGIETKKDCCNLILARGSPNRLQRSNLTDWFYRWLWLTTTQPSCCLETCLWGMYKSSSTWWWFFFLHACTACMAQACSMYKNINITYNF